MRFVVPTGEAPQATICIKEIRGYNQWCSAKFLTRGAQNRILETTPAVVKFCATNRLSTYNVEK